jgi:hypothetical protein
MPPAWAPFCLCARWRGRRGEDNHPLFSPMFFSVHLFPLPLPSLHLQFVVVGSEKGGGELRHGERLPAKREEAVGGQWWAGMQCPIRTTNPAPQRHRG